MDDENIKIPPYNEDAETSVIGSMMLSKDAITDAIGILKSDDFYHDIFKEIFEAIAELYNRSKPADVLTVAEELKKRGTIEEIGGISYLANLTSSVASVANTKFYCEIIHNKSTLRKLIKSADEIKANSFKKEAEVSSVLEFAEKTIFEITQNSHTTGFESVKEVLLKTFSEIEKRAQNPSALTGLTTGFIDLDNKISGFQKSDLILLAARPSMGKTALMVNFATNAAMKKDARVAMFSLEMSKYQLTQRIIASIAHIDLQKVISGNLNEEEWTKLVNALPIISNYKIEIDDTPAISPLEVKAKCRRMKSEKGLDLVIIDYLQLMQMNGRVESRQQEISAISRNLKAIAKELEVPVIALSQLSRAPEARADHRPILSDLRESGAIEQDADLVMFLYRDEYYNKEQSEFPNIGEVIIAKHRNGPTGSVELVFKKEYTKFLNKEIEK